MEWRTLCHRFRHQQSLEGKSKKMKNTKFKLWKIIFKDSKLVTHWIFKNYFSSFSFCIFQPKNVRLAYAPDYKNPEIEVDADPN